MKIQPILLILTGDSVLFSSLFNLLQTRLPNSEYLVSIQQRTDAHLIYPWKVNFIGWEGVVVVGFTLRRDEYMKELGVAKSSGYPLLDEAAMSAGKKPVPTPPFFSANRSTISGVSGQYSDFLSESLSSGQKSALRKLRQ